MIGGRRMRGGTRRELLRSASELLEGGGMAAVTLRAVGEKAGVSRQAPYKHFADKRDLLSVVAAGYFDLLYEAMKDAADSVRDDEPLARLEAIMESYVRFALSGRARYQLMFGPDLQGSVGGELDSSVHDVYELFVGIVAECQRAGRLPGEEPTELSALIYSTSHGAIDLTLSGHVETYKGLGDPAAITRNLISRLSLPKP